MIILNVTKWKNTGPHVTHGHSYILWTLLGVFQKISQVFLLDLMNNILVNNVYVKYIFIYPFSKSKQCLFQNSMIFPWATDLKFNDFSMIFSFLQISRTFHEIQWFFHDLETDLNFNDFSRVVGTLAFGDWATIFQLHCRLHWNSNLNTKIFIQENPFEVSFAKWWSFCPVGDNCYFFKYL